MADIGIGIVGGGYMGKAHAAAYAAVATLFETDLRPRLEVVCATSDASAERYRAAYGFARGTSDWRDLVEDPKVEAVIIAAPQSTHRDIALAAFAAGKPVFCEKPLGESVADSQAMVDAATASGQINMVGFNYIRTPASQFARQLITEGRIGEVTYFRGEHTEDFLADASLKGDWRTQGAGNGCMGDLAPHMINGARALIGPITSLCAQVETVHATRGGVAVTNDDQAQFMCRFENGAQGHLFFSRVATGRKMGYAYEIHGTKGQIRFDQEDQNALHLYTMEGPEAERGFRKILTGPAHPDYKPFCLGPGHGTGYQDQIIIEAKDFLTAIATQKNIWPTFAEGLEVNRVVSATLASSAQGAWVNVADY
ncbi:Gfo/Idh/MocA family protein [Pseudooctadecabacter jejudonensis]|uniref:Glucose--fructose oxidoreductase n=1 Tax=Pseudooctadecabacter jejudonensis TaxID=1391910 RepID=A0A1Y5SN84_9RHOB|nr:Gfo/Idh/MocA family oxidoreductase [Pseudooctadecabacter jejudonensis]SLN44247.1 Glucose--fructose oxidoreductase precursor [Pseudooctadecabacter jejudonensis]